MGSGFVAKYPAGGGVLWLPGQYVLGLRELGHDARWLEVWWTCGDPTIDRQMIDRFWRNVDEIGLREHVVLAYFAEGNPDDPRGNPELQGMSDVEFRERAHDAVLLNMAGGIIPMLREGFGRTVLYDI